MPFNFKGRRGRGFADSHESHTIAIANTSLSCLWEASPAQDSGGLAQVDYSGRRFGANVAATFQRPSRYAELRPWGLSTAAASPSQRGLSDRRLTGSGRASRRAVTAVCLSSDSRGLGIRTALSKLREMSLRSRPVPSQARTPGSCMSVFFGKHI